MSVIAVSLLGSTLLGTTANGIAVFMVFGAGLAAGLLGQIGDALEVSGLQTASSIVSWALPFEALYQSGLDALTSNLTGVTAVVVQLGPFGGAQDIGAAIWPWTVAWTAIATALAAVAFSRRDL